MYMYMYMYVCIVAQFRVSRIRLQVKADTGNSSEEIRIRVPDDWLEKSMGYDAGAGDWRLEIWRLEAALLLLLWDWDWDWTTAHAQQVMKTQSPELESDRQRIRSDTVQCRPVPLLLPSAALS